MKQELKISIITPNYNYANYIGQTIQSVIDQNYINWEHIIVDDGSTDNSVEIIESYIKKNPDKIKLIKQKNQGQTKALNTALKNLTGDIIGWINSDDYYNSNVFQEIINVFNEYSEIDAVYGNIGIINEYDELIKINKYLKFNYTAGVFNGFGKSISSNAIFWKKKLTKEVELMNDEFIFSMDSEYWSRLLYKRKIKKTDIVIAFFRWHPKAKTIVKMHKGSPDNLRAQEERHIIMKNSYSKLVISKFIPFRYSYPLYLFHRLKRKFLRGISGHYFNFRKFV